MGKIGGNLILRKIAPKEQLLIFLGFGITLWTRKRASGS